MNRHFGRLNVHKCTVFRSVKICLYFISFRFAHFVNFRNRPFYIEIGASESVSLKEWSLCLLCMIFSHPIENTRECFHKTSFQLFHVACFQFHSCVCKLASMCKSDVGIFLVPGCLKPCIKISKFFHF